MKIELLERRRLLSVAVAQTSPGYFEIQGDDSPNPINVQVSQGDDSFTLDGVTYSNVNFISVFGNGGDDTIFGSQYDDQLYGDPGTDEIDGNSGNDVIYAQSGYADRIYGDNGSDTVYCSGTEISLSSVEHIIYR